MAVPSTKATLKSYCLRNLGSGVIDINVSDDQVDDRVDEALQFYQEYHADAIEKVVENISDLRDSNLSNDPSQDVYDAIKAIDENV